MTTKDHSALYCCMYAAVQGSAIRRAAGFVDAKGKAGRSSKHEQEKMPHLGPANANLMGKSYLTHINTIWIIYEIFRHNELLKSSNQIKSSRILVVQ